MEVMDDDCINWCPECGEPREVCEGYKTCSIWDELSKKNQAQPQTVQPRP